MLVNRFILVLFVVYGLSFQVLSINVAAGPNAVLPTELNKDTKRVKKTPFNEILRFNISEIDPHAPYRLKWLRQNEEITVNIFDKSAVVANTKTLYATNQSISESSMLIELNISDSVAKPGKYTLEVSQGDNKANGNVDLNSAPILPIYSKPKRVLEGDTMRISCQVIAYPLPDKVEWFFSLDKQEDGKQPAENKFKHLELTNGMTLVNEHGVENDTLKFNSLRFKDDGFFLCNVSNGIGNDSTIVYLNVKERWAALWPFIGVVIEVTVLVTAILLFERHQMRSKKPKSDPKVSSSNNNQETIDKTVPNAVKEVVEEETPLAINHLDERNGKEADDLRQRSKNV